MLCRIAALRELFRANVENCSSPELSTGEFDFSYRFLCKEEYRNADTHLLRHDDRSRESISDEADKTTSEHASLVGLNDAADEGFFFFFFFFFFNSVPERSEDEQIENEWDYNIESEPCFQVPGSTTYSLGLYYMLTTPVKETPLLESFINGDDACRNSWFKLTPYISKGSWIVKQSVGKKACPIGQALEINYFRGKNYIELGVDIGSSTVAQGVVSLVLGYLSNLVIKMAILVQANTEEELPEYLLGTCRLNLLDASKAVSLKPL